jgi:hypothetical protein
MKIQDKFRVFCFKVNAIKHIFPLFAGIFCKNNARLFALKNEKIGRYSKKWVWQSLSNIYFLSSYLQVV